MITNSIVQTLVFVTAILISSTEADYACFCNYNVEASVYSIPDSTSSVLGYMYEFDCKSVAVTHGAHKGFYPIQFQGQLAYIAADTTVRNQTCPGSPQLTDIITTTSQKPHGHSTTTTGTSSSITTTGQTSATTSAADQTTSQATSIATTKAISSTTTQPVTSTSNHPTTTTTTQPTTTTTTQPTTTTTSQTTTTTTTQPSTTTSQSTITTITTPTVTWPGLTLTSTEYTTSPNLYWSMAANVSGTPLQYLGIGYNLLTGNPLVARDPGLLLNKRILQLTGSSSDVREASVLLASTCPNVTTKTLVHGSQSLQKEMMTLVQPSSTHPNSLTAHAFVYNIEFKSQRGHLENNNNVYQDSLTTCTMGSTHYRGNSTAPFGNFSVSREFAIAVCKLSSANTSAINEFLDEWGTSVVLSVGIGTKTLYRTTESIQQLFQTIQATVYDILVADSSCPDSILAGELDTISSNVKAALANYNVYKQYGTNINQVLTDHSLQIPVTWPRGTYGVMKTTLGCPGSQVTWLQGSRFQDTEDISSKNSFTPDITRFLAGSFASNNIQTEFCIKSQPQVSQYDGDWPRGAYCLLKMGNCPTGFQVGSIYWDDEGVFNKNKASGTLPDGEFGSNTRIYYCCRNDGRTSSQIILPNDRPFVLLRYGLTCQNVHSMLLKELYVYWDDDDLSNSDSASGMHPYDDGGSDNHRLHFCYYQKNSPGTSIVG
ncbi:mucin-3A-like isoform X2 [Dreissena polymorpha]|uniref:mucin-3A-like isoform X2 n=1 Tax=Dreissena polymorpha TaxID=45954 RepID=UPI0022648240|nr:mucin-3A-like isoform X2 [Dreissena polymorpha]